MRTLPAFLALATLACAEIHNNPGGKELPHDRFIRTVSEGDSPVQQAYIRSKDGVYVGAAIRKPKGNGPFPALIHFHGAPGGRPMEQLTGWSRGDTGGPMWERFLKEGYVVVVADYRAVGPAPQPDVPAYVDDGVAVVEYVRALPYVDGNRIHVYGVSLGGNLVLHLIGKTKVKAAVLGAPAPMQFLGLTIPQGNPPEDRFRGATANEPLAQKNIAAIQCPVLIFAGTADSLLPLDRDLHDRIEKAGKPVRLEIYEKGYHDFVMGPQGQPRPEPLMDSTLDALEKTVAYINTGGNLGVRNDIEFANAGGVSLTLDAYTPPGAGPFPAVIIVHGGGWVAGNKQTYVRPLFEPLTSAGFAWFSVNYRLAPAFPFPAATADVRQAVEYVRTHAAEYRVDPKRIAILGESAGGHIVSYVGARNPNVAAVVSFYGVHDIEARERGNGKVSDNIQALLGVTDFSDAALRRMREASPAAYVKKQMPPFLMIHGTKDPAVPYEQSVKMCEKMRAAGASCEVFTVEGAGHGVENWERNPEYHAYKAKMVEWLRAALK